MNRWTPEKANQWYARQPWLVGCNFIPSTAINQLDMWQAETFDPETIERELDWAARLRFNTLRVYLHDLLWEADAAGFKGRLNRFLDMTKARGIRPFFVFFDDCWNASPQIGEQPDPIPGVHNSGWVQSPGRANVCDLATYPRLQRYVQDILETYRDDERVLMWDLYNEPNGSDQDMTTLPLLHKVFEWAREINPSQPLTVGIWRGNETFNPIQLDNSDIITFHNYHDAENLAAQIAELKQLGRPLICTEWLRRPDSLVQTCLPVFKREHVGCCNWGLVSGKTQTIYPWGSEKGAPEPTPWFHDLLHKDGTPYDADEVDLFRKLI